MITTKTENIPLSMKEGSASYFCFVCLFVFICLFFVFNLQSLIHFINLLEEHNGIIGRAH